MAHIYLCLVINPLQIEFLYKQSSRERLLNMASTGDSDEALHVVMFPYFAFGHISPFVQLSNRLCVHGIKVSFFSAPTNISRIKSTLKLTP